LVPGTVEIAEEQHVVMFQLLMFLAAAQERELILRDDDPTGKMNKRQVD
jgi:hypothetical protein